MGTQARRQDAGGRDRICRQPERSRDVIAAAGRDHAERDLRLSHGLGSEVDHAVTTDSDHRSACRGGVLGEQCGSFSRVASGSQLNLESRLLAQANAHLIGDSTGPPATRCRVNQNGDLLDVERHSRTR